MSTKAGAWPFGSLGEPITNDSPDFLRWMADAERDDGPTLATRATVEVFDVDLDDERAPLRRLFVPMTGGEE